MNNKIKIYTLLFVLTVITALSSIIYLTYIAKNSNTEVAKWYPAPTTSTAYDNAILTTNLVEHGVFSMDKEPPFEPTAWRVPGYPLFAFPFYVIFHSFYPLLFVQIFTMFATAALIFKISERIMDKKWATVVSVLYILLPDTILSASAITTENLFVFLFMTAVYLFFFSNMKNIYMKSSLTGFLFALATYVREASFYMLVFFIPVYFIFYLKKSEISKNHILSIVLLTCVFIGTLMPWFIRNKVVFGVFDFASTRSNVLFRQNASQFYQSISGLNAIDSRNALLERAGFPKGPVPSDFSSSAALNRVSVEVITSHPFRYALFHLSTLIPFFTSSGAHEYWRFVNDMLPDFNPAPEPSLIQALHPFSMPVLVTVIKNHGWTLVENVFWALITLFALLSVKWSKNVRLSRMFLGIILYFAVITGPIAHARYRIPIEPLLLINAFSFIALVFPLYKKKFRFYKMRDSEMLSQRQS